MADSVITHVLSTHTGSVSLMYWQMVDMNL